MNSRITEEIILKHFGYFEQSISKFSEKYKKQIFKENTDTSQHVIYFCPLCLKNHIIALESGIYFSSEFSLDHYPPQNVGGKDTILTCKTCNNNAGTYEVELEKKMDYEALKNNFPNSIITNTAFKVDGLISSDKGYHSFINRDETGILKIDFNAKMLKSSIYLKKWIDNDIYKNDWLANLTISMPDNKKILKSILKTAYLYCFIYWGYDFAFSANAEKMRNILVNKEEYSIDFPSFWIDSKKSSNAYSQIPLGICFIEKPIEMKSYIVNIPFAKDENFAIVSLLIPSSRESGFDDLKLVEAHLKQNNNIEISFKKLEPSLPHNLFDYSNEIL